MKISFFFYLIFSFQLIAFNGFSQNKITIDAKDVPLEAIINTIEEQTEYSFVYNNDSVDVSQNYSVKVLEADVATTVQLLFENSDINYAVKKNLVVLSKTAQTTHFTISGVITDANTGETLLGANVILKNKKKGTTTNEYGFYSITLPEGNYIFEVSYLGYTTKEIELQLKEDIKKKIELEPSLSQLNEVVILSNNTTKSQVKSIVSGSTNMTSSEIKKLPSFFGEPDITRAVLTQPGVSSVGEGTTGFNVRGGNIDQNLILLDEAPLYNSSHLFGLFSIFNADAIKDLTLYKGGIPARFGGRGSSVLDIRQKNGNMKSLKGEGGLGLLFSRFTLEGPIVKDKVSFLLSGRRSYFDLAFPLLDAPDATKFYFYDLNTKLSWNINENNTLYASGFFGADVIGIEDGEGETGFGVNWDNATATLRWNHIFSSKLFANITSIYSRYNFEIEAKIDYGEGIENTRLEKSIDNWVFKPDFTYYQSPSTKMRFGINSTLYQFIPAEIQQLTVTKFDKEKAIELAAYYSIEKEWDKISLIAGMRYSWFANLGSADVAIYNPDFPKNPSTVIGTNNYDKNEIIKKYSGFEPRLSLKYDFNDRKAFKLGYNRMFQYIHLISNSTAALPYDAWKPSGTFIKPLEVNQFSAGYAYDTKEGNYNFSLESYYKRFDNLVEYKNGAIINIDLQETGLVPAKGYAYGLEVGIHKNSGKLTGNLNYTYSETKRKTISSFSSELVNDGEYFSSNYDRPHLLNITANYKLSKKWSMGAFFTYQTGSPTTQPNGRLEYNENTYLTYSGRNAYRLSDIHRMDISFTYTPKRNANRKWQGSWNFGVYNVYAHKNPFISQSYVEDNGKLITTELSLIPAPIPFITYNFKF